MLSKDYQEKCRRTQEKGQDYDEMLLNGALGICGEAGEVADIVKKYIYQGHKLDVREVALELGDVLWYICLTADSIGYTLDEIMDMNVEKLYDRYPEGFEADRSINRQGD